MNEFPPNFYKWAYYILVIYVIIRTVVDLLKWVMN